ncbi:AIPR family protein, partial [Allocoleopsis sp.]|uniref:AIPR family protein n=1 Tax=Allocoleopsis sp. TaxID=3088169 RepID=UPI002FD61B6D
MGRRTSINEGIKNTAESQPDDFFYFNNGVSAMCIEYTIDYEKLELKAENFQIINGAQTVGSLAWAEPNENIKILFRLTKTTNVKTSELRNQIINCNNIQNSIKDSDFRSNDNLQIWLEEKFKLSPIYPVLPYKVDYIRKRGYKSKSKGVARTIKLEDLAKIRYAFFQEPTLVHESPSSLWARRTEEGV